MSTQKITNISLADFERFLAAIGCVKAPSRGGHKKWHKQGLTRPIIYQSHKDPVPAFIVRNILRDLGMTPQDYFDTIASS